MKNPILNANTELVDDKMEDKYVNVSEIVDRMTKIIGKQDYESMKMFIDRMNEENKYFQREFFIWMASYMTTVAAPYRWSCNDEDIMCMAKCIKGLMMNVRM